MVLEEYVCFCEPKKEVKQVTKKPLKREKASTALVAVVKKCPVRRLIKPKRREKWDFPEWANRLSKKQHKIASKYVYFIKF